MGLIKCPECGKEVSDKAKSCPHCGFPMDDNKKPEENVVEKCPFCGEILVLEEDAYCAACGKRIKKYKESEKVISHPEIQEDVFHGVYRSTFFNGLQEVYCPRCGSENCSYYQEQKFIPGKTKTRYTANLNPLKPFTIVNKKEKVVKKEEMVTVSKFICNSCGKIFT